jgi:hypothetical protein
MTITPQYEALRRVHLIPPADAPTEAADAVNANVFRDLDSLVSEGGENFSTGCASSNCLCFDNLTGNQRETTSVYG